MKRSVTNIKAYHIDGRKFGKHGWYMSLEPHPFEEIPMEPEKKIALAPEEGL